MFTSDATYRDILNGTRIWFQEIRDMDLLFVLAYPQFALAYLYLWSDWRK